MKSQNVFPGWEIVRDLGSGASGKVSEIKKIDNFGGEYHSAMKVISIPDDNDEYRAYREEGYDDQSITTLFKNQVQDIVSEFQLMDKVKGNSHIVSCEDLKIIEHEQGIGWDILIRMELLEALPAYCNRNGISELDVAKIGIDICSALELCQKHNIIHRDIKPQNIFISPNGDYKLGDFGIARVSERTVSATAKTGTYTYMAPEVYIGVPYNASVDIYSLGIVLYWLLNERRAPFLPLPPNVPTKVERETALDRRMNGETLLEPCHGSHELKKVVLKACAFEKENRYTSAVEMKQALEALLDGCSSEKLVIFPSDSAVPNPNEDPTALVLDKPPIPKAEPTPPIPKPNPEPTPEPVDEPNSDKKSFIGFAVDLWNKLSNKMKIIIGSGALVVVLLIILLIVLIPSGDASGDIENSPSDNLDIKIPEAVVSPEQFDEVQNDEWSEWTERLPKGINSSEYIIQDKLQYRSTTLYCFTDDEDVDKKYLFSHSEYGPWGEWSELQSDPIEETELVDVETENRYMYRNLITKEYSDDYYMSTQTSTYWSSWYWSDTPISATSTRQVQTLAYYRFRERSLMNYYYIDSEWSQFSDDVIFPATNRLINTRMLYSYKPKTDFDKTASLENFITENVDYTGCFADVDDSKWYGEKRSGCIGTVVELGLMSPDEYMYFRPEQNMTIAEVIKSAVMLHRIYNGEEGVFVPAYESLSPYLDYALENGLINNNDFVDYNAAATRKDAAYILWHTLPQSEMIGLNIVSSITDMNIDSKYYKSVYQMAQSGIIEWPSPEYAFNPEKAVTRAEMATFLDRMANPEKRIKS